MNGKQEFKEFCEEKIHSFSLYLDSINSYRSSINKDKFSVKEVEFFEKHFELSIILAISNLDNMVILKNLHNSKIDWEVKFFIKKIFMNIYESLKAIDSNSKLIINKLCNSELNRQEYFNLNKKIKIFKNEYGYNNEMKNVRNIIAGHIHIQNFNLYFETLSNLNTKKSIEMGIEFMEINGEFGDFLLKNFVQKTNGI